MLDWQRLEEANRPLNAFTDFDRDSAGGSGSLAGMTIGVKANIAVKNMPWTGGMELYRNRIATNDADVVERLRAVGAQIIGIVNMEEAALGVKTDNPWFGKTHNPHKIGFTPGGSSGGSAAAVAAGLCDLALGTDTMGSVRVPAAYCGVYGYKPATPSVSQEGLELTEPDMDVIGPLARSLHILEAAGRVIGDFGAGQWNGKIWGLKDLGDVSCEAAVLKSLGQVKATLNVDDRLSLPENPSRVRYAGFIKTTKFLSQQCDDADQEKLSPLLRKLIRYGPKRDDRDWAEDQRILQRTKEALQAAVADGAMIILPTTPQAAFSHDVAAPVNQADFTCLASVADLPAISIPAGWNGDGLPVAVQLVAAKGREAGLFALAQQLDRNLNAYRPPESFYKSS